MVEDAAGPSPTGAEHIAVGEAPAGRQTRELAQVLAPGHEITHVDVDRLEARTVEGRGHLELPVDPLLPQDGHLGPGPAPDEGRGDVLVGVEAQGGRQARIVGVEQGRVSLSRAVRVVAQLLDAVAALRPQGQQGRARLVDQQPGPGAQADVVLGRGRAEATNAAVQPLLAQHGLHLGQPRALDLQHAAGLLGEEGGDGVLLRAQVDLDPAVSGEGHLAEGDGQPPVGDVVPGQDRAGVAEAVHGLPQPDQQGRLVQIGREGPQLPVDLRQGRAAHSRRPTGEVDVQQLGRPSVHPQHRGEGLSHIQNGREGADHHGQRGGHHAALLALVPGGAHGHRVLADGDADPQLGAELQPERLDRGVEVGVLAGVAGRGHPVGREHHPRQLAHIGGEQVGQRLGHREAGAGRPGEQRGRRPLADGHGLALNALEVGGGHGHVGHRDLPGADHRVPHHLPGDGAVADGDQELLAADPRQGQHPMERVERVERLGLEDLAQQEGRAGLAVHPGGAPQDQAQGQVGRGRLQQAIMDQQSPVVRGMPDHRPGRALPLAEGREAVQVPRCDRQHIALLGLVAPQLHGRHARLVAGDAPQLDPGAPPGVVDQLGQRVAEPAGADVVDAGDGVVGAHRHAAVDHLLAAALHLGVGPLHAGEVEILGRAAGRHAAGGAAPQADQHRRPSQHHQRGVGLDLVLLHMARPHQAHASSQHHGLVVAAQLGALRTFDLQAEAAEVASQVGSTELVVEGRGPQRRVDHDLQGRGHPRRAAHRGLPGAGRAGQVQIADAEAAEARLGLAAAAGGPLVPDLAPAAGGRARVGRDASGVVVGLDLHQQVRGLILLAVDGVQRVGHHPAPRVALDHGRVVLVGREHPPRVQGVGVADHLEEAVRLRLAVDRPAGVEDLVAAVLGVRLGEHHQLEVAGVSLQSLEGLDQVVDLVRRQGQAQPRVGLDQGLPTLLPQRHHLDRPRLRPLEQGRGLLDPRQHRLGHPVVQQREDRQPLLLGPGAVDGPDHPSLDPGDPRHLAGAHDLGGLAGPGRDRARARGDQHVHPRQVPGRGLVAVGEQGRQDALRVGVDLAVHLDEVDPGRPQAADRRSQGDHLGMEPKQPGGRSGRGAG